MKAQMIEFLICGTIGLYCCGRMYVLFPEVVRQAKAVVQLAIQRRARYDEMLEPEAE